MSSLDGADLDRVVRTALAEDLRFGQDATTASTVDAETTGIAELSPRTAGVLAGVPAALAVFEHVLGGDGGVEVLERRDDGSRAEPGAPALVLRGRVRGLLTAERSALNLLCHLSGIASTTADWVSEVAGTGCAIRDSRKTLPGLRSLQKYAVRCGGGVNHRLGLGDALLIKDNHVHAAGSVSEAMRRAREHAPDLPCEVEVDDLDQLEQALAEGADEVLLDNFTPQACARAVRLRAAVAPRTKLEASGGLRLDHACAYAESGVDYLAVGGLTHSVTALDVGMDLR